MIASIKRAYLYVVKGIAPQQVKAEISYLLPSERLAEKKIIVTGGGRGLGLAMARRFVAEGADVLICGRDEERLKDSAKKIGAKYLALDVTDAGDFDSFIDEADKKLGGLDCLVNNAGISLHEGNVFNVTPVQFDLQIATNLRGSYFLAQKFAERLRRSGSAGNILFISSERGSYVDDLPYGITKAAINSLVQGLAARLIKYSIRVNALAPGVTTSDMTGFKEDGNLLCHYNITHRVYLPDEVAEIATFLLSDASRCLNGQILVCNEGKSINYHWK